MMMKREMSEYKSCIYYYTALLSPLGVHTETDGSIILDEVKMPSFITLDIYFSCYKPAQESSFLHERTIWSLPLLLLLSHDEIFICDDIPLYSVDRI